MLVRLSIFPANNLQFDDYPAFTPSNNATAQAPPLFNPYHQFYFSSGFAVVPPPTDPYLPSSGNRLLEFETNLNANGTNTGAGPDAVDLGTTGGIGLGPTVSLGCFNFNAHSASLGCDSEGPACDFQFTGFRYNASTGTEDFVTTQYASFPACADLEGLACNLVRVPFNASFKNLTSVFLNATVAGVPKTWFMDDLMLGWFANDCADVCFLSFYFIDGVMLRFG